jgi:hypothetical protein
MIGNIPLIKKGGGSVNSTLQLFGLEGLEVFVLEGGQIDEAGELKKLQSRG